MTSLIHGIQKSTLTEKENQISGCQRQGLRMMEELGEGSQKVQNPSYKINNTETQCTPSVQSDQSLSRVRLFVTP